ncbi:MAG: AI-2E family transporter [Ruminococcus sp.]|nr:AI-2E family transporter [Ruminococcus sp.]
MSENEQELEESSGKSPFQEQLSKFIWTFLVVASAILFYYLIQYLGNISDFFLKVLKGISPVIWGLILAYLLEPIASFWERNLREWKLPQSKDKEKTAKKLHVASAILMVISAIVIIATLLLLIVPQISNSISGLIKTLPSQMESLSESLRNKKLFDNNTSAGALANNIALKAFQSADQWITSEVTSQLNNIINYFYTIGKSVFSVVYNLVVGLILSMYITIDKEKLQRQVRKITYSIFSKDSAFKMRRAIGKGNEKFSAAIRGKIIDSLIIGLICFGLLTFLNFLPWFNFPYPVLLAVVVGVTNVVPFFGPIVGGVITAVLVLFDNPKMVIPYGIAIVVLQQFDANYLDPRMVGGSIGLRPFWSITAVLLGSSIFGVPGFILGPPILSFIYEVVSEWTDDKIRSKDMAEEFGIEPLDNTNPFEDFSKNNPYSINRQNQIEKDFKNAVKNAGNLISGLVQKINQKK